MLRGYRNLAGIAVLAFIAYVAFAIGRTFDRALTIISIVVWVAVFAMVVYMVLIRGIRFSLFDEKPVEERTIDGFDSFEPEGLEVRGRIVEDGIDAR